MEPTTLEQARDVKTRATEVFQRLGEVVGVGIARFESGYGLKINLATAPAADVVLTGDVDGVPVRVEVVGEIRKRPA